MYPITVVKKNVPNYIIFPMFQESKEPMLTRTYAVYAQVDPKSIYINSLILLYNLNNSHLYTLYTVI